VRKFVKVSKQKLVCVILNQAAEVDRSYREQSCSVRKFIFSLVCLKC